MDSYIHPRDLPWFYCAISKKFEKMIAAPLKSVAGSQIKISKLVNFSEATLTRHIIKNGDLSIIQTYVKDYFIKYAYFGEHIVKTGNINVVEWYLTYHKTSGVLLYYAIKNGEIEIADWLFNKFNDIPIQNIEIVRGKNIEQLEKFASRFGARVYHGSQHFIKNNMVDYTKTEITCSQALKYGVEQQWKIHLGHNQTHVGHWINKAIIFNNLKAFKMHRSKKFTLSGHIFAKHGNIKALRYILKHGTLDDEILDLAIEHGRYNVIKWVIKHKIEYESWFIFYHAINHSLKMFMFCLKHFDITDEQIEYIDDKTLVIDAHILTFSLLL